MKRILSVIGLAVLSSLITLAAYVYFFQPKNLSLNQSVGTSVSHNGQYNRLVTYTTPFEADFTKAAEMTVHAVVHVKTAMQRTVANSPFEFFFGMPGGTQQQIVEGTGSGVIISGDGFILTNNHVIENAQTITVSLNDEREYEAELIGRDPATDLALLKIKAESLPHLQFTNSDEVKVGEWVLAVGNPFNLTSTVTAGIVSAKGRNIGIIPDQAAIESFIQTDAAVNPGNSGGALVNIAGELIGINTAISTRTGSFEGYSFAVPSNIARKVVEDLKKYGTVQRAFIGVNIGDVNPKMAEELKLSVENGVYVGGVVPNGAAADAGLLEGDVIISIDGKTVNKSSQLQELIGRKRPGDKVNVTVNRKGEERIFDVELRNRQGTTELLSGEDLKFGGSLGAKLQNIGRDDMRKFGINRGLKVVELKDGKLKKAGIPQGFIITKVNNRVVNNAEEFLAMVERLQPGDGVLIQGYLPNGRPDYFAFGW